MATPRLLLEHIYKVVSEEGLNEISLSRVTYQEAGRDPVLKEIEINLPTETTCLIESENPAHAGIFLRLLAGQLTPNQGSILWNQNNLFSQSDDSDGLTQKQQDPHQMMAGYFEGQRPNLKLSLVQHWTQALQQLYKEGRLVAKISIAQPSVAIHAEVQSLIDHFEANSFASLPLKETPYGVQKLAYLVSLLFRLPELLIMEDPAYGMTDAQWLNFLDFINLLQRRGSVRHIFMTNTHPTAMVHLNCQRLYIADGLLYVEEPNQFKKASHF